MPGRKDRVQVPVEVKRALAAVRNDEDDTNWLVVDYENVNTLRVKASGAVSADESPLEAAREHLVENVESYLYLRYQHMYGSKFVWVFWRPERVSPLRKALLSTHKPQAESAMKPHQVQLVACEDDELTEEIIQDKIDFAAGTKKWTTDKPVDPKAQYRRARADVGISSHTAPPSTPTKAKSASVSASATATSSASASAGTPVKKTATPVKKRPVRSFGTPKRMSGGSALKFVDEAEFQAGVAAVHNDDSPVQWFVAEYASKNTLGALATGESDVSEGEFMQYFQEQQVRMLVVRVVDIVDGYETVKFAHVFWQPDSVRPLTKAYVGTLRGRISELFRPYTVDIFAVEQEECTPEAIINKVMSASLTADFTSDVRR